MEVIFKLLHFLWLLSATISLQLAPPINIETPIGLDLGIGGINTNLLNNINSESNKLILPKLCFCLPNNANSQPVISLINPDNKDIERIVVYLYKINGEVKVYIPNKNTQDLFPEPNFDDDEDDILISVGSEKIIDLFDSNFINPEQTVVSVAEEIINESQTIDVDIIQSQPINMDLDDDHLTELLIEDIDYSSLIASDDNSPVNDENLSDGQNILIDISNQIQDEVINSHESNIITNLAEVDQLYQITSNLPFNSDPIIDQIVAVNNQELDTLIPDLSNSDPVNLITSILSPTSISSDSQGNVNKETFDKILNLDGYDQLKKIFSVLPPKSQPYPELSVQKNPFLVNSKANSYITFHDWFEEQLKYIVLLNLETPTKIIELRERIKKVLQDNGMRFSVKGIVTDSNGNLVRMNNIKLRPILIGSQIGSQEFLGDQTNIEEEAVSYIQFIEIILETPPKLLGTLVIGTVYLPRNVHGGQKKGLWNNPQDKNIVQNKDPVDCVTCKQKPAVNPYSVVKQLQYPPIPVPYGQYHGLPLRRNFSTGSKPLMINLPYKIQNIPSAEPLRRGSEDVNRNGLGGIFEGLLGNFGIAPAVVVNPTRRLLGGTVPKGPKPGPKAYPNDVLPGFRIIGGNAATSSGTPLVNKGRSGFEKPSFII